MLKSTWIPFTWAQNLNKLEILEEIGTIASQISKKVEFIPRLRSGELSSIFASANEKEDTEAALAAFSLVNLFDT